MEQVEALAARLIDLEERRDAIQVQIDDIKQQLIDAVEVGGTIGVGDLDLYTVQPGRRTFNAKLAAEKVPPQAMDQVCTAKIDSGKVKRILGERLWEECCTQGQPFLRRVGA